MRPNEDDVRDLDAWIKRVTPEIEADVAMGVEKLYVYVRKGWQHRKKIPTDWQDIPIKLTYTGTPRPL